MQAQAKRMKNLRNPCEKSVREIERLLMNSRLQGAKQMWIDALGDEWSRSFSSIMLQLQESSKCHVNAR
jgi:hypothetical protein